MFAVIYRGFVFPEKEEAYTESWKVIVDYFKSERGALGSSLHKTAEGEYIAYSRWPDEETRNASWGDRRVKAPAAIDRAIVTLESCIDRSQPYDEICMDVVDDRILAWGG